MNDKDAFEVIHIFKIKHNYKEDSTMTKKKAYIQGCGWYGGWGFRTQFGIIDIQHDAYSPKYFDVQINVVKKEVESDAAE